MLQTEHSSSCPIFATLTTMRPTTLIPLRDQHRTVPACSMFARLLFATYALMAGGIAKAQMNADAIMSRVEAAQSPASDELAGLTLTELMKQLRVPGMSVAVVDNFTIHWAKGYGVADASMGRQVNTSTRFQAASISKPVTALAAMHLVQTKQLDLDVDVNKVLRSWQVPVSEHTRKQAVTPRALFSHTSGAVDGLGFDGYDPSARLPSITQIIDGKPPANNKKILFARAPFVSSKYSGGGLMIMQQAIMDISRQPFDSFMEKAVLGPLRMSNSSFRVPNSTDAASNAALGHDKAGLRSDLPWRVYPELAAAGLWTTPTDLAHFIIEIQSALRNSGNKILTQQSAKEMIAPVGVGRYAIGLAIDQRDDGWHFSHAGDNWGYRAFMIGHIRKGYGYVIMVNGENGMALMNQVADRIANAYKWGAEELPPPQ